MTKKLKWIIAVIVLVLLAAGSITAYLVISHNQIKNAKSNINDLQLVDLDYNNIVKLDINSFDGEEYILEFSPETSWVLTNRDDIDIQSTIGNVYANYYSQLTALKNVGTLTEENRTAFGFDTPSKLTLTDSEGKSATVIVGKATATNEYFYAMVEGRDSVYTIDYTTGSLLYLARNSLKDSKLLQSWSTQYFTGIEVTKGGKPGYIFKMTDEGWDAEYPVLHDASSPNVQDMLYALTDFDIDSFGDEGVTEDKLADYGYDDPYYSAKFTNESGETLTILVKDKIESFDSGTTEILYKEMGQIATVQTSYLSFLEYNPAEFLITSINTRDITDVKGVSVDLDDSYDCDFEADFSYDFSTYRMKEFSLNGKDTDVSVDTLNKAEYDLISAVLGLKYESVDTEAELPDNEAMETIEINFLDGTKTKYEYIPLKSDTNRFYVVKDGEYTGFIARRKAFSEDNSIVDCYSELQDIMSSMQ